MKIIVPTTWSTLWKCCSIQAPYSLPLLSALKPQIRKDDWSPCNIFRNRLSHYTLLSTSTPWIRYASLFAQPRGRCQQFREDSKISWHSSPPLPKETAAAGPSFFATGTTSGWPDYPYRDLTHTTIQGSRVSCLAQTGFAAFGKVVQLISGSPYAETEQLSRLTSPSGILATSWW